MSEKDIQGGDTVMVTSPRTGSEHCLACADVQVCGASSHAGDVSRDAIQGCSSNHSGRPDSLPRVLEVNTTRAGPVVGARATGLMSGGSPSLQQSADDMSRVGIGANPATRCWRKVLYERQPYEDNFVDPGQFLQELRKNENVKTYHYLAVVVDTFAITQQISLVVLFIFVFAMLMTGRMERYSVLYIDTTTFFFVWLFYLHNRGGQGSVSNGHSAEMLTHRDVWRNCLTFGRQVVSLTTILVLLTPILSTLTVTFSDDTIVCLSIFTMFLHVLVTDYNYLNGYTTRYQPNIAVNSGMFGVILMASRIRGALECGSLIVFGTLCFPLSPIIRHTVRCYSRTMHAVLTVALFFLTTFCLVRVPVLAGLYVTGVTLVSFVIPGSFVCLHSSVKYQISGPWDEAKPINSAAAAEWANAGLLR